MKYNIRKEKVFNWLTNEENFNKQTKFALEELNGLGIEISRLVFLKYKREFTQLQSSEETELETLIKKILVEYLLKNLK